VDLPCSDFALFHNEILVQYDVMLRKGFALFLPIILPIVSIGKDKTKGSSFLWYFTTRFTVILSTINLDK